MKFRIWIPVLVFLGSLIYLVRESRRPAEPEARPAAEARAHSPEVKQKTANQVGAVSVAANTTGSLTIPVAAAASMPVVDGDLSKMEGYPYRLPNKAWVEFRVAEGGYAIGFGDIVLGKVKEDFKGDRGAFEPAKTRLWDSSQIPYVISADIRDQKPILEAIAYFARETPIQLVPHDGQKDLIVFTPAEKDCASVLGKVGGPQPILVAPHCDRGDMIHEIMHALGFVHEHSRVGRDQYVDVLWDNIQPEYYLQFHIVPESLVHTYEGSVFDFDHYSTMLYPPQAFAKSAGQETLRSKTNTPLLPTRDGLSTVDRERLFYLYGR